MKRFLALLIGIFMMSQTTVTVMADTTTTISNGIYVLQNDVYHEHPVGMASSRAYLEPEMAVTSQNRELDYTLHFVASEYIQNYRINVNGEIVETAITETSERVSIDFVAATQTDEITVMMYVEPMGRDVEFQVLPLWDSLTLVEALPADTTQMPTGLIMSVVAIGAVGGGGVIIWQKKQKAGTVNE